MPTKKCLADTAFFVIGFVPIVALAFNPLVVTMLIIQKVDNIKKAYEDEKVYY